ncbi:MAG: hypothetical protein SFV15_01445 [Polyangiaceae bacterium]|nr:hypothetical protein [Polyangiaceae bacterium]
MQLPYTTDYPGAVSSAAQALGFTFSAVVLWRPLRSRSATALFVAAILVAAALPIFGGQWLALAPQLKLVNVLQASSLLALLAMLAQRPAWLKALATVGVGVLLVLTRFIKGSDDELMFAHLFCYGVLYGAYLSTVAPPTRNWRLYVRSDSFRSHDAVVFTVAVAAAFSVTHLVFDARTANGDELANTFQASLYAQLKAYAPIPKCPEAFENWWVFRHAGRAFSQYTPGWPLFMAVFVPLGALPLAGPVMFGILSVAVARISRRLASALGDARNSRRIVATAGVLGPLFAMLGPSLMLNAASRFSHTMVCACFAWSVESLCVVSERGVSRHRSWRYGTVLGASTVLGLATRPADGAMLGIGIFLYFLRAAVGCRISWRTFWAMALAFSLFGALTLIILRLQLGEWFQTAYALGPSIHPEAKMVFSVPKPNEFKYGFPLATGSYCWWPAAPALGVAGLMQALAGRERRIPFMFVTSGLPHLILYALVEFGRGVDNGLGPRYQLPLVVPMATGMAALLAPLAVTFAAQVHMRWRARVGALACAVVAAGAIVHGVVRIAPLVYPVAATENRHATSPIRNAQERALKQAIVWIIPGDATAHETNLAQNDPTEPNPDVFFFIWRGVQTEQCVSKNFPGRTWYRSDRAGAIRPF